MSEKQGKAPSLLRPTTDWSSAPVLQRPHRLGSCGGSRGPGRMAQRDPFALAEESLQVLGSASDAAKTCVKRVETCRHACL